MFTDTTFYDQTLLTEPFKETDVTAILLSLQTDEAELKSQRAKDVTTITGLKEKLYYDFY